MADASRDAFSSETPSPDRAEARAIQDAFRAILTNDPQSVVDNCRDQGGRVVLNADDLFKKWPEYARNCIARRWLGAILYPIARDFIDEAFAGLLLAEPATGRTVVFTAGGGASGKSTVLRAQANRPDVDFIVDTTFSRFDRALRQIDQALAAGREVEVNYVYREFGRAVTAMVERALDPKVGRIVPIDDLAGTHSGAQECIYTVMERYEYESRVAISLWESRPGNIVKRLTLENLVARELPALDELQREGQAILDEIFEAANRNPDGQWKDLSRDRPFYEAARSKAQRGVSPARLFDPAGYQKGEAGSEETRRPA